MTLANIPAEPLCAFNDGRHKIIVTKWGRLCAKCAKTWEYGPGGVLVATWALRGWAVNP